MCGFILTNFPKTKSENNFLQHRGPDNSGYFSDNQIRIIFNRLSIIDLDQAANQPMQHEKFIIVFNGEIFNYLEIKKALDKATSPEFLNVVESCKNPYEFPGTSDSILRTIKKVDVNAF